MIKTELNELTKLGVPAILAQLSHMSLAVIDTLMAGRVSPEALAAIAVGTNILNPIVVFILGVFLALNPIVAHLNGRGNFSQIGVVFQQSVLLSFILAIPCIYLLFNSIPVMELLDIQSEIVPTVDGYLKACSWGIIPLFAFLALRFCNEGLFSNRAIMLVSVLAIPFNILFNLWFIWGGFGLEPMGAVGVGYATSVVWLVMFIAMAGYTIFTRRYRHLEIISKLHAFDFKQLKEIITIGLPMGVGVGMEIAMFAIIGLLIGSYQVEVVAAHQIAINIASMAYMIPLGLSIAISARVGFFAGRQKVESVKIAGKTGISVAIALACLSSITMYLFASDFAQFYTDDRAVIVLAAELLFLSAIFQLSDAIQVSISGALRGLKDTTVPMIISGISYWIVGFPVGYYFAEYSNLGVKGYWMGIISGLSAAALMLFLRYLSQLQRIKKPS
ncbi:MATE family efflux transporter [Pleionea mediterranea]|uniref:Multidrug-efflux transporter n=1 Tax=Pleionea mediterranea TaxID=523701 RepID=A0A316FMJ5_9GAMM|nr:MATE family efflux transporter [Pleionea mediterranea]PWK49944.1 MATE family multidrug resistance protein [Pleionea mediterranea]